MNFHLDYFTVDGSYKLNLRYIPLWNGTITVRLGAHCTICTHAHSYMAKSLPTHKFHYLCKHKHYKENRRLWPAVQQLCCVRCTCSMYTYCICSRVNHSKLYLVNSMGVHVLGGGTIYVHITQALCMVAWDIIIVSLFWRRSYGWLTSGTPCHPCSVKLL